MSRTQRMPSDHDRAGLVRAPALGLLIALFAISSAGCKDDAAEIAAREMAAEARANARKRIEQARKTAPVAKKKKQTAPKVDTSAFSPEVKAEYESLIKLPASEKKQVVVRMMRFAARGPEARDAIGAMANDSSLPEPQRALAGIWYCRFYRFDAKKLISFLDHKNPFLQRAAAEQLKNHGGAAAIAALKGKIPRANSRGFRASLEKYVRTARKKALPARANEQLHKFLDKTDKQTRKMAGVVLTADYFAQAEGDMLELLTLRVADKDARMWLATAIVKGAEKNVAKLTGYTKRGLDKYLRYNAVLSLAKLGAPGKAVLKKLAATPGEPLKPHIEKKLR